MQKSKSLGQLTADYVPGVGSPLSAAGKQMSRCSRSHPTIRFDTFMKASDASYQHGEAPQIGERFVRKMATYGNVRPSACFTSESRPRRPEETNLTLEASTVPALWHNPIGDPRAGSLEYEKPPEKVDMEFLKLYKNHSLMLPSERKKEALRLLQLEKKWRDDREKIFNYKKRITVLENHYPNGVVGVDGPLFPGTSLFEQQRERMVTENEYRNAHDRERLENLYERTHSDEALKCDNYGEPHNMVRSRDIPMTRKCVDPARHPYRFFNTQERCFPEAGPCKWDPKRAAMIRSHEVREREYCPISGNINHVELKQARPWFEQDAHIFQQHLLAAGA